MLKSIRMTATRGSTVNGVTTETKHIPVDLRDIVKSIHICDGKTLLQSVYLTGKGNAKPVYWSNRKILKIKYHYHGELVIYYHNKKIKIFNYITEDDRDTVHKWLDEFEKNIKLF